MAPEEKIQQVLKAINVHAKPETDKMRSKTLRMLISEDLYIQKLARKYAKGNWSAWVRYAATHYRPDPEELIDAW